jgi:hypothetical protein
MRRFLNNLFGNSRTTSTAPRSRQAPRRITLQVEDLEERMVPSASSFNMHSVVEPATGRTVAVFHVDDNVNNALLENTGPGAFQGIAPAGAVRDFSVGLDPTGHAAVFAHMNGVMQEFTQSTGWVPLNEPVPMAQFAAVQNGDLYAVAAKDNSLWQFTPIVRTPVTFYFGGQAHQGFIITGGWSERLGANTFIAVDAITSHGQDIVVGMNANRQLSWFLPATGYLDSFSGSVNTFSVGLDPSGYFDVFVLFGDPSGSSGNLQEYDPSQGGWQPVIFTNGDIGPLSTLSATTGGQCFILNTSLPGDPILDEYSPSTGSVFVPGQPLGSILDVSAAGADNVIVMDTSGHLLQLSGTGWPNDTWRELSVTFRVV